ncbi:MAG TPA: hypothetical protein VFA18_04645 [Gemmataceae bacterium]|nr:hypothetical protein [Gemmataceae bacterium]
MMKTFVGRWLAVPAVALGMLALPGSALAADHHHHDGRHRGTGRFAEHERHEAHFDHHGPGFHGAFHYDRDYFRHFRPGYRTIMIGPATYYYYPGLPVGYQTVVVGGRTYYLAGGVYYVPYAYSGSTIYLAVRPPV